MKVKSESEVAQSCPTLCDPMDCSAPGSSIHGIFQARVLEWVAIIVKVQGRLSGIGSYLTIQGALTERWRDHKSKAEKDYEGWGWDEKEVKVSRLCQEERETWAGKQWKVRLSKGRWDRIMGRLWNGFRFDGVGNGTLFFQLLKHLQQHLSHPLYHSDILFSVCTHACHWTRSSLTARRGLWSSPVGRSSLWRWSPLNAYCSKHLGAHLSSDPLSIPSDRLPSPACRSSLATDYYLFLISTHDHKSKAYQVTLAHFLPHEEMKPHWVFVPR